jgi:hypothetical protein
MTKTGQMTSWPDGPSGWRGSCGPVKLLRPPIGPYVQEIIMNRSVALLLIAFAALGAASGAFALQSSKPNNQAHITCRDKLGAKHIKKADMKAEHDKCMSDPMGYQ